MVPNLPRMMSRFDKIGMNGKIKQTDVNIDTMDMTTNMDDSITSENKQINYAKPNLDITNVETNIENDAMPGRKLKANGVDPNQDNVKSSEDTESEATQDKKPKTNDVDIGVDPNLYDVKSSEDMISEKGWAWMVLLGCFLSRCFTDGLAACLGIFIIAWQDYFGGSLTELTWITSLIVGLLNATGPFASVLLRWFTIRQTVIGGAIQTSIAFILASFATETWHLYITSTIAGIGFGILYTPSLVILNYYFNKRLGHVSGISSCGSALGWLTLPSLFQILIGYYQWQGAILILAAMVANLGVCGAIFRPTELEMKVRNNSTDQENKTKERHGKHLLKQTVNESKDKSNIKTQENKTKGRHRKDLMKHIVKTCDLGLFKNLYFLCGLVAFFLYGAGFIIFTHYLASRAVHIGFSKQNAAFVVSTIGIGSGFSRLTHGIIIDRHILSATSLTSLSYIVCAIFNILIPIWDEFSILMVLAAVIGLSSGVFHSTFPILAKVYCGIDHVSCGLGWLNLTHGIGIIVGSYLTGVLVDATGSYDFPFYLAGICLILCAMFTSAKSLVEYLKHISSAMATNTAMNSGKKELKGEVNKGAEFDNTSLTETKQI